MGLSVSYPRKLRLKLQHRLFLYLTVVHAIFFAIVFASFKGKPLFLVIAELGLVASFSLGLYLLRRALLPYSFSRQFQDILQDENYASRLLETKNDEINDLVKLFNRMLEALYQERIRLGEQRGFLERLLAATPSAVIVFDFDGKLSLYNASARELLGDRLTIGECFAVKGGDSSVSDNFVDELVQTPVGESRVIIDQQGRRFRCQRSQFVDRGFQRDFLLIDEITAELANSEKATYEKLVRVLAHEVNNTVAATGSVLESLLFYRRQLREDDGVDFSTAITAVQKRNTHLGEFIDRFTQVVKMPEPHLRPCNVDVIVDNLFVLYRQQCHEHGIKLAWQVRDVTPSQMLDSNLFEQALMNILKNAIEAVIASNTLLASADKYVHVGLRYDSQHRTSQLTVIDSGGSLNQVPNGQLFTPFFTTKKGGQGIGLVFVREVLNRHGITHRLAMNDAGETQFTMEFSN